MKKRILVLFMVVALLLATSVSALAVTEDVDSEIQALVQEANDTIDGLIDAAISEASVEGLTNQELMEIITELRKETREISKNAIKEARDMGCKDVRCYFVEVEIGDKLVKIDPLVVGGW